MAGPLKVAILVLNYNGWRHLDALLKTTAFLRHDTRVELIVVDNASADGTVDKLKTSYAWVTRVRNKGNFGWGEGYNAAIATLVSEGRQYSHYMFLNNDVFLTKEWLEKILAAAKQAPGNVGEIGCRSIFASPFVNEPLVTFPSQLKKQLRFSFLPPHSHAHIGLIEAGPEVSVRIRHQVIAGMRTNMPESLKWFPAESSNSQILYSLLMVNVEALPCSLTFEPGLRLDISVMNGHRTIFIRKSERGSSTSAFLYLRPREALRLVRLESPADHLQSLIQNSGLGINRLFEGYDLHCYEPISSPQNNRDLRGVCGVCKLVTREAYERVNGFNPNFFMYYEDLDFSLNLKREGFLSIIEPEARMLHVHAGTSGAGSLFFKRQVAWSRYYFHHRHAGLFRKGITWLREHYMARQERAYETYPPSRVHEHALTRFELTGEKNYFF